MATTYPSAAAFRQALEARLRNLAQQRGVQIQGLRLKIAIERLLARLFHQQGAPWLLKGGYAMELRFRPRARTTRDLDLTIGDIPPGRSPTQLIAVHEALLDSARIDLGDFFEYTIAPARSEIRAAPGGGGAFPVTARMAGRDFARFHIDVGFGDAVIGETEALAGDDLLSFAGIPPARAMAIPKAQQFAEKVHAYTYRWAGRENTRSRDLVDMVVLIERGDLDPDAVQHATIETFARRGRHEVPRTLQPPPDSWAGEVPAMAREAGTSAQSMESLFEILSGFWERHSFGRS